LKHSHEEFVQELNLAPGLLLSMPQLSDPNFTRAVVLMLDHGDDGSFGLILNHPTPLSVSEVLSSLEVDWCGDSEAVVWSGGPVMPTSGWMLHSGCDELAAPSETLDHALEFSGTLRVSDSLYMSTSEENIKILAEAAPERLRFLMGYAGWSEGQLASEMAEGSWLHADINSDILFGASAEEMWALCLKNMGIDPEAIVQSRGVH
jgi:putative transcriptional regulator